MANKEFINRLKIEREELKYKRDMLFNFIISDNFQHINYVQQLLLPVQLSTMETYLTILEARMEDLVDPNNG